MKQSDFDRIYRKYVNLVHSVVRSIVKDYHMTEDICQEVFAKLFCRITWLDEELVKGWLLVVADTTMDFLRKRKHYKECFVEDYEFVGETASSDSNALLHDLEMKEFNRHLFRALHEKNPEWYEVIMELDVTGIPPKEAARNLGISENNLRVKHYRAKEWIRKKFGIDFQGLF